MNTMPLLTAFALCLASLPSTAAPPSARQDSVETATAVRPPQGFWKGRVVQAKLDVEVLLRWEGEALIGTIDIPAQGLLGGPLIDCSIDGARVRFRMDGTPGDPTFEGELAADGASIKGTFMQGGAKLDFELQRGESPLEQAARVLAGFDDWVAAQMKRLKVPGVAVAVVSRGEVVLSRGYGIADVATGSAVTADTLFAIGSTTKAFTTFALAQAIEEGLLDWDAPVRRWLPKLDLDDDVAERHLSLRDMCSHRSGLPRHDLLWYANPAVTREEMVERLAHLEPTAGFRERWQYNNLMFAAAGVALAKATGRTWEEWVRERILTPLGMTRTTFGLAETLRSSDAARPHDRKKMKDVVVDFRDLTEIGPAGSIHSSANDMARWIEVLLGRGEARGVRLLSAGGFQALVTPVSVLGTPGAPTAYGLGWMLDTREGKTRVHHGGGIDGFTTQVELYPDERLGIFTVTNRASPLTNLLASQLAERFLGLEVADPGALVATQMDAADEISAGMKKARESERIADAPPARPLEAYAATYSHPGYGELVVTHQDGRLRARYGIFEAPLKPWHFEVFSFDEADGNELLEGLLLHFRDDVAGLVSAVEVPLEASAKSIRFERGPDANLGSPEQLAACAGAYSLLGQTLTVVQREDRLVLTVPGQPPYTLVPGSHGRYRFEALDGFFARFERAADGAVEAVMLLQPNGNFRAPRR